MNVNKAWVEWDGESDAFGIHIETESITFVIVDLPYTNIKKLINKLSSDLEHITSFRTSNQTVSDKK